jgi:hypothetical protein
VSLLTQSPVFVISCKDLNEYILFYQYERTPTLTYLTIPELSDDYKSLLQNKLQKKVTRAVTSKYLGTPLVQKMYADIDKVLKQRRRNHTAKTRHCKFSLPNIKPSSSTIP